MERKACTTDKLSLSPAAWTHAAQAYHAKLFVVLKALPGVESEERVIKIFKGSAPSKKIRGGRGRRILQAGPRLNQYFYRKGKDKQKFLGKESSYIIHFINGILLHTLKTLLYLL